MSAERPNFLEPLNDAAAIVRSVDVRLQEFAEALEMAGNERLGQRLRYLAESLGKAREFIEAGSSAALDTIMTSDKTRILNTYRRALVSIASNTCCAGCGEASLVAQKALREPFGSDAGPLAELTPVMRAAETAAKVVEGWSDSKKKYAERVIGGTAFCSHGVMAAICPTCAVSRPPQNSEAK